LTDAANVTSGLANVEDGSNLRACSAETVIEVSPDILCECQVVLQNPEGFTGNHGDSQKCISQKKSPFESDLRTVVQVLPVPDSGRFNFWPTLARDLGVLLFSVPDSEKI
jgi:hypothetical protein